MAFVKVAALARRPATSLLRSAFLNADDRLSQVLRGGIGWQCVRHFASYEGQTISDEQLLKGNDDWAIEETNFCLGRFPAVRRFPETSDMSRRVLMMMEIDIKRMFTRLRDGTVIPVSTQTVYDMYDNPESVFNYFERPIVKFTWDETYDDAWESEEPEFEAGEIPSPPEEEIPQDDESMERFMVRKSTAGQ